MTWQAGLILIFSGFALLGGIVCMVEAHQRRKLKKLLRAPRRETIRHVYAEHAHAVGHLRGVK